ncbi:UDP-2,4-diacetamido-2,4,6-trideoxy-beta-L-altropyranose hydrolase [Planctobacterium marinum]|uniref:UDP-2,4-diacetamido-2,4,6-trideoxy-beta-L-altropyranose hydrolase n=1 Tax=Planctobacterium marinum TaxID=1631968 RepID=A0AA48HJX7_9ALTE|nr:UDP-2,4-diacetamido-2,4,6-trideoxy-beta-L-altropyranose hydrolase [Planctobacterium marinum]
MKAYFRTEASNAVGMGHLMRCMALAQILSDQYIKCSFIVPPESIPFCLGRHDWDFSLIPLQEELPTIDEYRWFSENIDLTSDDILVLDSYKFTGQYISSMAQLPASLVLFDDCNDRDKLEVDVVINSAGGADSLGYEVTAPDAHYCLGEQYRLLRREFLTELPQPLPDRNSLTIVMGGTDPQGLSLRILQELSQQEFYGPVRLVTTSNNPQLEEIKLFTTNTLLSVQLVIDCQDLATIFSHSRLTLSAAGSSQFELLAMHCPTVLLVVADNQFNAAQASENQGWCRVFDVRETKNMVNVVSGLTQLWQNESKLQSMMKAAQQHADTKGNERILDTIARLDSERLDGR